MNPSSLKQMYSKINFQLIKHVIGKYKFVKVHVENDLQRYFCLTVPRGKLIWGRFERNL